MATESVSIASAKATNRVFAGTNQASTDHHPVFFRNIYQHVALDGELEAKYQEAMKKADL